MAKNYFQHDYNARNDRKISSLVKSYKSSGYGIFWCTAEMLHEEGGEVDYDQLTIDAIANELNEDADFVQEVLEKCIKSFKLFTLTEDNKLTSNRVKRNMNKRKEISDKRSKAGKQSASVKQTQAIEQQNETSVNKCSTNDEGLLNIKEKEIKGKEIKDIDVIAPVIQLPSEIPKTETQTMTQQDFINFQSKLIQDVLFIEPLMSSRGIHSKSDMLSWIKMFNAHIVSEEKLQKDYNDYRKHFKYWFNKQDTSKPPNNGVVINPNNTVKKDSQMNYDKYKVQANV